MRLLLDTHTFIWYSTDSAALSQAARLAIADQANQPHLSVASLWEIAIKVQMGKLGLHCTFDDLVAQVYGQQRLHVSPIGSAHLCKLASLPSHHRDPFDRMIVAQALADDMTVVGRDEVFDAYGIKRIW